MDKIAFGLAVGQKANVMLAGFKIANIAFG